MFCPKCRAEYVPGITRCADCGVDLVDELPAIPEPWEEEEPEENTATGNEKFEELLITFYWDEIEFIKSILENSGIAYYFKGEFFQMVQPFADPARLMVRKDQIEEARRLLKEMQFRSLFPPAEK